MILILNWIIFIMTFGIISIAETTTDIITLDTPISELNDLTLNELFEYNSFTTSHNFNSGAFTINLLNNVTGIYYLVAVHNNVIGEAINVRFRQDTETLGSLITINNDLTHNIGLHTLTNQNLNYRFGNVPVSYKSNSIYYYLNLTDLAIDHLTQSQLDDYYDMFINGGDYTYEAVLNDLDMTDFIIISSSFVLWLWFMRFLKGVL